MIPPLPPPMPPWPGGKPPWERDREAQLAPQQPQPQAPPPPPQPQPPPGPALSLRPQVVHGLVPPQMLHPTFPNWITPTPYFRPQLPPVALPVQFQQPPPQSQPAPAPAPPKPATQQQIQQTPSGPVKVERAEEKTSQPQPFRPVVPVPAPGLPHGARQREYWRHS